MSTMNNKLSYEYTDLTMNIAFQIIIYLLGGKDWVSGFWGYICDPLSENPALPANIEFEL